MDIIFTIVFSLILIVALSSVVIELRRDLTMMQQNSYRPERYMRWLSESKDTVAMIRLLSIATLLFGLAVQISTLGITMVLTLIMMYFALRQNLSRTYKKPLVMTKRAWRIFTVQMLLAVAVCIVVLCFTNNDNPEKFVYVITQALLAVYCCSHIITILAVYILTPVEKSINRGYYNDAQRRLRAMPNLKIIGITGSYGKTSTKHFLHRILSEHYDTLMTPGSFNTTMGVIRTIREHLKSYNEVFIVEMGAKQKGDIREICKLVHPEIGIITAVGPQHLETFKSIENVYRTKFELVNSLPSDGLAVVNNNAAQKAERFINNRDLKILKYAVGGLTDGADYKVSEITYSSTGTSFTLLAPDGTTTDFTTPLMGEGNILNLVASIIVARSLDVPEDKIQLAVSRMEQVEHRLSVKHTPGCITILDDAFNSNPVGSAMALDVLGKMEGGRKFIVTPGMVELGAEQYERNHKFGKNIAATADVAIIVNAYNREAITAGIAEGGMDSAAVHTVDTFAQAQQLLGTLLQKGDVVLYENDLPDTFK
ncbi:MAG: UDP-N-acetylmuramoyl-tripeptide--D-alanyl-D-alanine ligase [Muribaculaceae bacterium]|nr:UDP-N-acetylmuramoyl-tripeptide--D-alanyl-D-alanine ligase [Muribaculaceae bacterium]